MARHAYPTTTATSAPAASRASLVRFASIGLLALGGAAVALVARANELRRPPKAEEAVASYTHQEDLAAAVTPQGAPPPSSTGDHYPPVAPPSLAATLATGTDFEKIAAVDRALAATDLASLDALEGLALPEHPGAAPKLIHGLAKLASKGSSADRRQAAATLSLWLKAESSREGRDAVGNVVNLVEALGELRDPHAVSALTDALDAQRLGLPVETLAVQQLAQMGDRRAMGAIGRFKSRLEAMPPAEDAFAEDLRSEAHAAADSAIGDLDR